MTSIKMSENEYEIIYSYQGNTYKETKSSGEIYRQTGVDSWDKINDEEAKNVRNYVGSYG